MQLVDPRAERPLCAISSAARSASARKMLTPMAKFGAATTPMPCALDARAQRRFVRLPARRADHDGHAARGERAARSPGTASATREVDRHVGGRPLRRAAPQSAVHRCRRPRTRTPAHSASTSRPIRPRPTSSSLRPSLTARSLPRRGLRVAKTRDAVRVIAVASDPPRPAPTSRSAATPPATPCAAESRPARRRCASPAPDRSRRLSPTAHRIAICGSTLTSANSRSDSTMAGSRAIVVDRHRHADLGGRHHVDGGRVPLERLEHAAQETVRHQHARRRDVDDRDAALAGDGGQRPSSAGGVGGDQRAGTSGRRLLRMRTGMLRRHGRKDRARVQNLGAEVRQLRRLAERQVRHDARLRRRRADRRSACRRRRSRSESRRLRAPRRRSRPNSPTRRGRASSSPPSTVAPTNPPMHRHAPDRRATGRSAAAAARRVSSSSGDAAVCDASVTITRRASTHRAGMPATVNAAVTSRLLNSSPTATIVSSDGRRQVAQDRHGFEHAAQVVEVPRQIRTTSSARSPAR